MELLIAYGLAGVLVCSVYLIINEILTEKKLMKDLKNFQNSKSRKYKKQEINSHQIEDSKNKNRVIHPSTLMVKSLRHLDFMTQFEDYLDASGNTRFKYKYREAFTQNKIETQQTVLKSAKLLSKGLDIAA